MVRLLVTGIIVALSGSAHAQNAVTENESQSEAVIEKPIITRVDDAGLGWLEGSARADIRLAPASRWNIDFADDSCGLSRTFGEGDDMVMLDLRQFGPQSGFDITVAGSSLKTRKGALEYKFSPGMQSQQSQNHMMAKFGNGFTGVVFSASLTANTDSSVTAAERASLQLSREKSLTGLSIERGFARRIHLDTGPLHLAMQVMRQCTLDLLSEWGLKADGNGQWASMAQPKNAMAFAKKVQEVFPRKVRGKSGIARIRLMVDEKGQPTSCHLQTPSEEQAFKDAACRQMLRYANFHPTLDSEGEAVPSYYITKVSYIS